ncbi:D-glucuronyl C5-epimerase family protein [Hyphobacterium sp.]|uniref:D-glucuronyl C5-epimerase family protein n=1 Tax=Hyphobacterium sp. TaxID=2004662 RepID=UPI003BA9190B
MSDNENKPDLDRDKWSFWLIAVTAALTLVTFLLMVKLTFDLADGPPATNSRAVNRAIEATPVAEPEMAETGEVSAAQDSDGPTDEAGNADAAPAEPAPMRRANLAPSGEFVPPAPLPEITTHDDSFYDVPMLVRRVNNDLIRPYYAEREGLRVRYTTPTLSSFQPDMMYIPMDREGRVMLPWQTSNEGGPGLWGIFPGNELVLLDNYIYDFGVNAYYVRIHNLTNDLEGFMPLETLLAETEVVGDQLWEAIDLDRLFAASIVELEGMRIYAIQLPVDRNVIEQTLQAFEDPSQQVAVLGGGQNAGVHPVFAANSLQGVLAHYLEPETSEEQRARILQAAEAFFDNYVFPEADELAPGIISWPYEFPWNMNWGVRLDVPWYSAYANARFGEAAALMYRLTGEERYAQLARDAMAFVTTPLDEGGAEYEVSGFHFNMEYYYPVHGVPNTRVIDGEMIAVVSLYNAARLLEDSEMMRQFFRQGASLAMNLSLYEQEDGRLLFAAYVEQMPHQYQWVMWSNLMTLANIMKDRRFFEWAQGVRPHISDFWCESNGC